MLRHRLKCNALCSSIKHRERERAETETEKERQRDVRKWLAKVIQPAANKIHIIFKH